MRRSFLPNAAPGDSRWECGRELKATEDGVRGCNQSSRQRESWAETTREDVRVSQNWLMTLIHMHQSSTNPGQGDERDSTRTRCQRQGGLQSSLKKSGCLQRYSCLLLRGSNEARNQLLEWSDIFIVVREYNCQPWKYLEEQTFPNKT